MKHRIDVNGDVVIDIDGVKLVNEDRPESQCKARLTIEDGNTLYLNKRFIDEDSELVKKYVLKISNYIDVILSDEDGEELLKKLRWFVYDKKDR